MYALSTSCFKTPGLRVVCNTAAALGLSLPRGIQDFLAIPTTYSPWVLSLLLACLSHHLSWMLALWLEDPSSKSLYLKSQLGNKSIFLSGIFFLYLLCPVLHAPTTTSTPMQGHLSKCYPLCSDFIYLYYLYIHRADRTRSCVII